MTWNKTEREIGFIRLFIPRGRVYGIFTMKSYISSNTIYYNYVNILNNTAIDTPGVEEVGVITNTLKIIKQFRYINWKLKLH